MRQLDLFAGIGGISLAAEWVGIETVAFCEKEPFCQDVLRRRFPGRPIYDDVFDLTREVLERDGIITRERGIDIVAGGFPCQPFSHAGKRTGTADDRYLWPEMCRIIGELRPSWVFAENVDGLVSMAQSGGDIVMEDETTICKEAEMVLETIRKDLEVEGYRSVPIIIPACGVGASHRRYRIFIVGYTEHHGSYGTTFGRSIDSPGNNDTERKDETGEFTGTGGRADGQIMGYTERSGCGGEPRGRAGKESADGHCELEEWVMADSDISNARGLSFGKDEADTWIAISSQNVAHSTSKRLSESKGGSSGEAYVSRFEHRSILGSGKTPRRATQPRLGGSPYELSDWLDGWGMNPLDALLNFIVSYPQPALMGQEQYSWEPPRVATGIKNRASRLKALGNAVDPLQALPILYGIRVIHEFLMKGGRLS